MSTKYLIDRFLLVTILHVLDCSNGSVLWLFLAGYKYSLLVRQDEDQKSVEALVNSLFLVEI